MTKTFAHVYEPIDLCACYEPIFEPPASFWDECRRSSSPFTRTVERQIGNTWYVVETECDGNEPLADKVKRLIFSDKGAVC